MQPFQGVTVKINFDRNLPCFVSCVVIRNETESNRRKYRCYFPGVISLQNKDCVIKNTTIIYELTRLKLMA